MADEIKKLTEEDFTGAITMVALAMDAAGIPFNRSPTVYANLLTITLSQLFSNLPQAEKALDAVIVDMRAMLPKHHAQIREVKKQRIREALTRTEAEH